MKIAAKFEKVSFEVYKNACMTTLPDMSADEIITAYEEIRLLERATKGSAGYDFFSPLNVQLQKDGSFVFPTGVRCRMPEDWVLMIFPRSGTGFKTGLHLANTVGVIDSDYYYSDNEGHILVKMVNDSALAKNMSVKVGSAICQGVLLPFGVTEDDSASASRNGGFGSSGR